jgi:hypothetical protein
MSTITMSAPSARNYVTNTTQPKSEFKTEQELTLAEKQVISYDFVILRERATDKGLAVAYTIDGLKAEANKTGRLLYYNLPFSKVIKFVNGKMTFVTNVRMSNRVYVEKFYPRKFKNPTMNKYEWTWINKCLYKI